MLIYLATNRVNGKPYVGKTEKTIETRWKWHLNSARKGSPNLIHRALRKYGDDAFSLQIVERDVPTKERLAELEAIWIVLMNSKVPNGYNMSDGGEGNAGFKFSAASRAKVSRAGLGRKHSAETKRKISQAHKGKIVSMATRQKLSRAMKSKLQNDPEYRARMIEWNHSQEHRDRISAANSKRVCLSSTRAKRSMIAKLHGFGNSKGWNPSTETRRKMSEAAYKKPPMTEETRRRMSESHTGSKHTPETRQKMSAAAKLRPPLTPEQRQKLVNMWRGKHHSEEARRNMGLSHLGSHHTEETKQKMREARKLQAPASEATRQRMRESSALRWARPEEHQKISNTLRKRVAA
jgi:group I intron endonuclease